jgi:hypothetical protein
LESELPRKKNGQKRKGRKRSKSSVANKRSQPQEQEENPSENIVLAVAARTAVLISEIYYCPVHLNDNVLRSRDNIFCLEPGCNSRPWPKPKIPEPEPELESSLAVWQKLKAKLKFARN